MSILGRSYRITRDPIVKERMKPQRGTGELTCSEELQTDKNWDEGIYFGAAGQLIRKPVPLHHWKASPQMDCIPLSLEVLQLSLEAQELKNLRPALLLCISDGTVKDLRSPAILLLSSISARDAMSFFRAKLSIQHEGFILGLVNARFVFPRYIDMLKAQVLAVETYPVVGEDEQEIVGTITLRLETLQVDNTVPQLTRTQHAGLHHAQTQTPAFLRHSLELLPNSRVRN
ncbi:hypothetical protein GMRT_10994 [Giardia muris]|uniref:Uncharacterized protein n=1 Tax=Giardia muris TaxID=5742 RepID=A0A4Z1T9Y2_GIAMU|nr:hypothetical protein GMRT_10994 [Giardia muris]|eukprot:TNJ29319.1 hypothetical protein GMRT_10994 [Giardia muris]